MRTVGRVQQRLHGAAQRARRARRPAASSRPGSRRRSRWSSASTTCVGAGAQRDHDRLDALRGHGGEVRAHLVGDDRAGELDVALRGACASGRSASAARSMRVTPGERRDRPRRCRAAARGRRPRAARRPPAARGAATSAAVSTRPVDPVQDTTMSASASSSRELLEPYGAAAHLLGEALRRARRCGWRRRCRRRPRAAAAWRRRLLIAPAPTTTARAARRGCRRALGGEVRARR